MARALAHSAATCSAARGGSHNCKSGQVRPKTNEEFWAAKRARTIQRDSESSKALAESGWRVVSLWECEINRAASNGELQDFLLSRLTTEGGVASILLNSLINAACDGTPGHPSSEQDINGVLAAVHGIRANDEIEAMLAVRSNAARACSGSSNFSSTSTGSFGAMRVFAVLVCGQGCVTLRPSVSREVGVLDFKGLPSSESIIS
jgi:hypothetical protein